MAVFKTHRFLPEVFQTNANKKFLNATLDQLVSEPDLKKINGYIGRRLAPTFRSSDSYIQEPTTERQDYQLEPSVIIENANTGDIDFVTTYQDTLSKVGYYGGFNNNQNRLFDNEYYSYDPKVDLDKFVNFSQYYWLPQGPDSVQVSATDIPTEKTYTVSYNPTSNEYTFTDNENIPNPQITLARGGVYKFVINEPGNQFFIQSKPGSNGINPDLPNQTTRSILGVTNNGEDQGTVTFSVPLEDAQVRYTSMPVAGNANYATALAYNQVQGAKPQELIDSLGGVDGPVKYLDGTNIIFVTTQYIDDAFWVNTTRTVDGVVYFDQSNLVPLAERTSIYNITIIPDSSGDDRILLTQAISVINENKVRVISGQVNAGREFFKRLNVYNQIPQITAPLPVLYYQSSADTDAVGFISIVDPITNTIDPDIEIAGRPNYTSPNGVVFTNGMKIKFDTSVTTAYQNKTYYIEGVGASISLTAESELIPIEDINTSFVLNGGTGYVVGDRITLTGGTFTTAATAVVSSIDANTATATVTLDSVGSSVASIAVVNGGSGYLTAPSVTVSQNSAGTNASATATITAGVVTSITVTSAGSGFPAAPEVTIAPPESGVVSTFDIVKRGDYSVLPTNPVTVTGGTGSGARLEVYLQPITPNYFTINRSSIDRNPWSRTNRWVHTDVLKKVSQYNLNDLVLDQYKRAQRPIVEFNSDYQLNNSGAVAKSAVDQLDTTITSAFTQVNGVVSVDTTTFTVGTLTLTDGDRIIFASDVNNDVRNKIYNFSIELAVESPGNVYKAYIVEATDADVVDRNTVVVLHGANGGKQWHYNGTLWVSSQQKTAVTQEPLYDVIDTNGVSFSNKLTYAESSFAGTKIFSYSRGTGTVDDPVLGFPLNYKNFATQGDIQFANNFDSDQFTYLLSTGAVQTVKVNSGYLQKNISTTTVQRENIWTINKNFSRQYQEYQFTYNGTTNLFPIDFLPDTSINQPNIKVYINNKIVAPGNFATTQVVNKYAILVNADLLALDDAVFITIFNKNTVSNNAYYEVPDSLDVNSLNKNLSLLTLGQMRNHLVGLKNNTLNIVGSVPGDSNLRDIVYRNNGGSILQHSSPSVYSNLFLNHPTMNFVESIRLANREYSKFKDKFLELAANLEFDRNDIAAGVDAVLNRIHEVKNETFPWYYSDMVPHGINERVDIPAYTIYDPEVLSYEITRIFNDTILSNKAVLVYLTRTVNNVTAKTLLVKDRDYTFNKDRPAITFTSSFRLLFNDIINIIEYNNTDGSWIPETPTKMGMYPKFYPEKYSDNTLRTTANVIQGHDGSLVPAFDDFRDDMLIELERRIYNNIKTTYDPTTFNLDDYKPGKFRTTDYTRLEFTQILSQGFLAWVGTNRIDFSTNNTFSASDPFTWNYKNFTDVVNGESLPGTWRAVYKHFFDTDRPHTHPWEMLGFSEKPTWWENRYGPAPYTGGNEVLWSDLSLGYIHDGDRAGFDLRYQRPNLSEFIPVDDAGALRSPEQILVRDFDSSLANSSFAVGDIGPAESAWRRSSEYPFMMHLALALAKPGRYFGLQANVRNYKRNTWTAQFEVDTFGQHITPTTILVHGYTNASGTIERTAGYVNWIRDYVKNLGVANASTVIKNNLKALDVRLTYKFAGYTDKKYIELLAEQNSPTSVNDSIVIPDENYSLELYKGSPLNKITFSAVIVQKSARGYTVSGYDLTNPFFSIVPSEPNNNAYAITVGEQRGVIYRDFKKSRYTIPYGFEFNTRQQVVDFLVSYQRGLIAQGFVFKDFDKDLLEQRDWILSAKEFLHWTSQGWREGSVLVLSPVSTSLKVYNQTAIIDEITNTPFGNRVLDVNFSPIRSSGFTISRENNLFTFDSNLEQTIGFAELSLVQFEHLLVLDNVTDFNDVIYVPELGNRQYRIRVVGAKTSGWNGSLELPGFIFSNDKVANWQAGQDYFKGTIVKNKQKFYTALQNITASPAFQTNYWKQIPESELRSGMINNFATNAQQGIEYYDIDNQPLNEDIQLFSNGLIGFRDRQYFTNLGISTTTQSKFYQGLIKQKGTASALNALKGAVFGDLDTDLTYYENWAVRAGEYGALDTNNFVEVELNETLLGSNPASIQFLGTGVTEQADVVSYNEQSIYKSYGAYTPNFLRTESLAVPALLKPLPVAGFVNLDDVDKTIFDLNNYNELSLVVDDIGTGYKIWTAKDFTKNWNVYRASLVDGLTFALRYTSDDQAEVIQNENHGLSVNDLVVIKNFDSRFNGVYKVNTIVDTTRFTITINQNLQSLITEQTVVGSGLLFVFTTLKINTPELIESVLPVTGWEENDKVWVENLDANGNWGVYNKTSPWVNNNKVSLDVSKLGGDDNFGYSVDLDQSTGQILYVGSPGSVSGRGRATSFLRSSTDTWNVATSFTASANNRIAGFGEAIANGSSHFAVGAPNSVSDRGVVYVYFEGVLQQIITNPSGSASDKFGQSLAMSRDGIYLYVGEPGDDKVYAYARQTRTVESETITGDGATATFTLGFSSDSAIDLIVIPVIASDDEQLPTIDYTVSGNDITFGAGAIPANLEQISIVKRQFYYTLIGTIAGTASTNFGVSLSTNRYGDVIAVGANEVTVNSVELEGSMYVYHRTITEFTTDGVSSTFTAPDNFSTDFIRATLNDIELVRDTDYYTVAPTSIQFNAFAVPIVGQKLRFETNQFVLDQTITASSTGKIGQRFGRKLELCGTGCNLYATAPEYFTDPYQRGAVHRFLNVGRIFGKITGEYKVGDVVTTPTVTPGDAIIINDRYVEFSLTTLDHVVAQINNASIPGVTAETVANGDTTQLKLTSDVVVANEKLSIKAASGSTAIADLGLELYKFAQIITHPNIVGERFASAIGLSQGVGKLVIGSDGGDTMIITTFDKFSVKTTSTSDSSYVNDALSAKTPAETTFDSGTTTIIALIKDSGAVYVYDLLDNPFATPAAPSLFAFSQKLTGTDVETGFSFGADIAIVNDIMVVGAINDFGLIAGGGSVYSYYNKNSKAGWDLLRYKEPRVAIDAINSVFIYNKVSQNIINFLDILDPAKGKVLGVVDQDIDLREDYDPASYNNGTAANIIVNGSFYWSDSQVGRTWWDTGVASFIDYEQGTLSYREKNWGALFPGSDVAIYEWVKSDFLPSQYVTSGGDGVPKYEDDTAYTTITTVDPVTGIIIQKFYYWVRGRTGVDVNISLRRLSTSLLETYILNPKDQGIPYFASLAPNSGAVFNVSNILTGTDIILHIDNSTVKNQNLIHSEYSLVQKGNPLSLFPKRITDKIRDSLAGFDNNGSIVPNPNLNAQNKIGILNTPLQSAFVNRLNAVKSFVVTANTILKKYPVLLTRTAGSLYLSQALPLVFDAQINSFTELSYIDTTDFADGYLILIPVDSRYDGKWTLYRFNGVTREFELNRIQAFKTDLSWTPTDWYDSTYVDGHDINYVVNTYGEIQVLTLAQDDYVKVSDDGSGKFLIYRVESDGTLSLIAAENATVTLSTSLYSPTAGFGFDSEVFDSSEFDPQASIELLNIFNAVSDEILLDDLAGEKSNLYFSLINFVMEEQKHPDWVFKTSFIDAYHNLRGLDQLPNYVKDNQYFYQDYINEVKPYRTKLRDFSPAYSKLDSATGSWTDFDIPARYFANESTYRSPNIQVSSDSTYFTQDLYKQYSDNYKLKISDIIVGNVGVRYSLAPNVDISGGGGTGAKAITSINPSTGQVTSITVTNPGSGYTTTPTVLINGVGEGATAYPILRNEYNNGTYYNTVRNIDSTIKFDRITYTSNVAQWAANIAYEDTIVVNGNFANSYDLNRIELGGNANVAPQDTSVTDVYFKPDGTKMYIAGDTTDGIYEYTLSSPWEVTTASNVAMANVNVQDSSVQGLFFREDGYRMYTVGDTTNSVYEYRLATPWSVNTAANISVVSINSQETSATSVELSTDGTRMYVLGTANDTVYEYELSVPWLASSATYSTRSKSVASEENTPTGMRFREDGKELFVTGQQYNKVWSYILSTAWDISTATLNNSADLTTTNPTGMYMRHDGTRLFVADDTGNYVQQYDFNSNGITPIDGNLYITSGNIIFYNNTAYLATNANVSSQTVFDFTRFTEINSGNALLSAADRITSYYVPSFGRPSKDLAQLMFGTSYPGNKVQGMNFAANSFTLTSDVIGFSYTGHKITSANTQQVDFIDRGFNLNDPIKIEGMYDNFNFENNATFKVVSITRDEMMLSGQPIESVVTLFLGGTISANAGDYITQSNTTANARVLNNYTSSTNIAVIQEKQGWNELDANVVSVNGVVTTANVRGVLSSGTANVKISNLYIDDILDSNIASFYTDSALGTRPEDINIAGGFFLDAYNSHAPEELIPGRMYDTLEMRVFTNTASNTASYGFRVFEPMDRNREYYRISANSTTTLTANLALDDVNMFVDNAALLPDPGTGVGGAPGEVFINGELIYYYQKYDDAKILTADVWAANTEFTTDSLITYSSNVYLVLANVYANSTSYINTANIKQVYANTISQLRRGVDGTGANVHYANARVVDSSLAQQLPNIALATTNSLTGEKKVAANVTWRVSLNNTISANIGDYMTMTGPTANVRILETVANANVVAVDFVDGNLRLANANVSINGTTTTANVTGLNIIGEVLSTGNVSVAGKTIKQDYLWKVYGTGDTLDTSTTEWAEYIKEERSYTP